VSPAEADAAVARGAAVLDERGPAGWRDTVLAAIREDRLDMASAQCCVLGHVFGSYGDGWRALATNPLLEWGRQHGFAGGMDGWADLAAAWARLSGNEVPA
jgi:hypothetical protein